MQFTIEFFCLLEEDDAHATLGRITHIGTDLERVTTDRQTPLLGDKAVNLDGRHQHVTCLSTQGQQQI